LGSGNGPEYLMQGGEPRCILEVFKEKNLKLIGGGEQVIGVKEYGQGKEQVGYMGVLRGITDQEF